ncbi:MAG: TIGR03545 family protein [Spirochaetes bacterium]|nr:TIGR03545 family protein [Spirochaetota bacterium]
MNWINLIILVIGSVGTISLEILLSPWLLKIIIENGGTALVGARVNVESVESSVHTLTFGVKKLEITDVNNTGYNIMEVGRVRFMMDAGALVQSKTVINKVAVEDIRMNTKRRYDGRVARTVKKETPEKKNAAAAKGPGIVDSAAEAAKKKLEIDTYLKGDLKTIAAAKELEKRGTEIVKQWTAAVAAMDYDKQALRAVEKVKNLDTKIDTSSPMKAQEDARVKIAAIMDAKKSVDTIVSEVTQKKQALERDVAAIDALAKNVEAAAKDEYAALAKKLNLEAVSVNNVAAMVLGDSVMSRVNSGLYWFDFINKKTPKGTKEFLTAKYVPPAFGTRGYDVRYPVMPGGLYPDFHIGNVRVTVNQKRKTDEVITSPMIVGEVNDIVSDQDVIGRPTKAHFSVIVPAYGSAGGTVDAVIDRRNSMSVDTYRIAVERMPIRDMAFGDGSGGLPRMLKSAVADATVSLLMATNGYAATMDMRIKNIAFEYGAEPSDEFSRIVKSVMKSIDTLTLTVKQKTIGGRTETELKSNLDEILAARLKKLFGEKVAELTKYLETSFAKAVAPEKDRVLGVIAGQKKGVVAGFSEQESRVNAEKNRLDEKKREIERQLKAYEDQAKSKMDAEKRKAEEAAKSKAQDLLKGKKLPF